MRFLYLLFFTIIVNSCKQEKSKIKSFKTDIISAIIEIPAGTNIKYEFDYESKSFEAEIINGKKRTVNYLPYPGNYGYIKNTFMDPSKGGDGDALDVLVISSSISQGSEIKIEPVGILKLEDKEKEDHKIIAVPLNESTFFLKDSIPISVKNIIKTWFCNYKGRGKIKFLAWGNKNSAMNEIKKWKLIK